MTHHQQVWALLASDPTIWRTYSEIIEPTPMNEPYEHSHDGDEPHGVICPSCGEQGFDGRGTVQVESTKMYLRGCWNCGLEFASETRTQDK